MAITVKGVNLQWNLSSEEILKRTDELIEKSKKVYDAVGALNPDDVTYENCLKASELFDRFFLIRLNSCTSVSRVLSAIVSDVLSVKMCTIK